MAFDPWTSHRPLIVYIDIKSPYAFVARDPTRALAARHGIDIDWRPLTLDIPSYLGSARTGAGGKVIASNRSASQWDAVRYAYRDARRYAALGGHTLRGTTKIWDSSLAHIGLLWAKQQGDGVLEAYLERVYPQFWRRELDIEAVGVIERELIAAGADVEGFRAYSEAEGREHHDRMQAAIFDAGIFGVPAYVLPSCLEAGDWFFGREHLPRVFWLLTGGEGPAPDVAFPCEADAP
ncbi:MAG: DsbA family protein [Gammaproteobacteria bacterium]|nr:DsbA family protein [Gammaproteobacteria bacterium]